MTNEKKTALIIGLAAFIFFGFVSLRIFTSDGPFAKYPVLAAKYIDGQLDPERLLDLSPLYFWLNVAAIRYLPRPLPAIQWLQIALVSLSAVLIFTLAKRSFGMALGLTAAAAFVLSRSTAIHGHLFEPEALLIFLVLGTAFFAYRAGFLSALAAGLLCSLCILTRLNYLPLAPVTLVYLWLNRETVRKWAVSASLFTVPLVILPLLVLGGTGKIVGYFPLSFMNPGQVFYEGNNPNASGEVAVYPPLADEAQTDFSEEPDYCHAMYRILARRTAGRNLSVAEVNGFWAGKAMNYLRDHPGRFLRLAGRKALLFFHGFRAHDTLSARLYDRRMSTARVPSLPFALISSLALIGLFAALREWRRHIILYAVLLNQLLVAVTVYASERQRAAVISAFIYFACAAVHHAARNRKRFAPAVPLLLALLFLFARKTEVIREHEHFWRSLEVSRDKIRETAKSKDEGRYGEAAASSAEALAAAPLLIDFLRLAYVPFGEAGPAGKALMVKGIVFPEDFSTRFDQAILLMEAGKLLEAERLFTELAEENHLYARGHAGSSRPEYYLGRIAALLKNPAGAEKHLKDALEREPGDPQALALLYALTDRDEYKDRLFRYFDDADGAFYLARAFLDSGRNDRAMGSMSYLVETLPEYRRGRIYLAAALGAVGEHDRAAEVYIDVINGKLEPVMLEKEIVEVFRERSSREAGDWNAKYWYGIVLSQYGRFEEALRAHRDAYALTSDPMVKKEMEWLEKAVPQFL